MHHPQQLLRMLASYPSSSDQTSTFYIKQLSCLHPPHQIQDMDNINKMLTVLCVLIMCFTMGGLAEQCGGLSDGGVSAPAPPSGGLGSIISKDTFSKMLKHRNDNICPAKGFYSYEAFIQAAKSFPAFGNTGNVTMSKREVAAFLGQTSHETSGGSPTAPDGPYASGYCFIKELQPSTYCQPSSQYPCAPGKQYYGRGPIQLTWNYNYGQCGKAIGADLLKNPDLVATNAVISFKTALWFWMTTQKPKPKPSCHDVITGKWTPSAADKAAHRLPGYGTITNIINGGECGRGPDKRVADRIGYYKKYCGMLGVSYGPNIDCYSQKPFGSSSQIELVSSI